MVNDIGSDEEQLRSALENRRLVDLQLYALQQRVISWTGTGVRFSMMALLYRCIDAVSAR